MAIGISFKPPSYLFTGADKVNAHEVNKELLHPARQPLQLIIYVKG